VGRSRWIAANVLLRKRSRLQPDFGPRPLRAGKPAWLKRSAETAGIRPKRPERLDSALQAGGHRFDPATLHLKKSCSGAFLAAFASCGAAPTRRRRARQHDRSDARWDRLAAKRSSAGRPDQMAPSRKESGRPEDRPVAPYQGRTLAAAPASIYMSKGIVLGTTSSHPPSEWAYSAKSPETCRGLLSQAATRR
jgi:hypothetical protein